LGAAKRTLDGEDRSEMIAEEGKAGRKIGKGWSAILVPWPAASNNPPANLIFLRSDPWAWRCTGVLSTCTAQLRVPILGRARIPASYPLPLAKKNPALFIPVKLG